ncbi:SDR family NAD(P)-dependent oxidoreductase [Aquincola tertiaricarbonis]|uniref:SDR family NAD(P)-dependent oxidoreductase n=1 Tax=Aquincola tertiaricarbonis TaxID=391953 RepID=A0ABY4SDG8_AQUTE|nr:SDR family NAD(P)-dependent oxidoreductase [Aquincola tertiaricarbonis]URI10215.1 SDR family NAD(P)-dependent oxidoreductase [Aquincola tertiaricarbonis]
MTTVLVTGASAGFGLAIAQRFLADGAHVIAAARRLDRLQALAEQHPGRVLPLALDVTDRPAAAAALAALPAPFAEVDVLVNNAGLALGLSPAHQADIDDWERMIATNCAGLVNVTRAIVPGMVARGRGTVINIGSIAGEVPYPGGNVYGATKAFVHQFTHNLNADLIGTGVRASCVEPGLVGGTEFSNVRFHGDDQKAASVYAGTQPLTAEDIADTVHWLASRPPHVTINAISMMPNCQSFGPLQIKRGQA